MQARLDQVGRVHDGVLHLVTEETVGDSASLANLRRGSIRHDPLSARQRLPYAQQQHETYQRCEADQLTQVEIHVGGQQRGQAHRHWKAHVNKETDLVVGKGGRELAQQSSEEQTWHEKLRAGKPGSAVQHCLVPPFGAVDGLKEVSRLKGHLPVQTRHLRCESNENADAHELRDALKGPPPTENNCAPHDDDDRSHQQQQIVGPGSPARGRRGEIVRVLREEQQTKCDVCLHVDHPSDILHLVWRTSGLEGVAE